MAIKIAINITTVGEPMKANRACHSAERSLTRYSGRVKRINRKTGSVALRKLFQVFGVFLSACWVCSAEKSEMGPLCIFLRVWLKIGPAMTMAGIAISKP